MTTRRQVASIAEVAQHNRMLREKDREAAEKAAEEARKRANEIRDWGQSGPGERLRSEYESKRDSALNRWLDGDPGDSILAIQTHTQLRAYRDLIQKLSPKEMPSGRGTDPEGN